MLGRKLGVLNGQENVSTWRFLLRRIGKGRSVQPCNLLGSFAWTSYSNRSILTYEENASSVDFGSASQRMRYFLYEDAVARRGGEHPILPRNVSGWYGFVCTVRFRLVNPKKVRALLHWSRGSSVLARYVYVRPTASTVD